MAWAARVCRCVCMRAHARACMRACTPYSQLTSIHGSLGDLEDKTFLSRSSRAASERNLIPVISTFVQ